MNYDCDYTDSSDIRSEFANMSDALDASHHLSMLCDQLIIRLINDHNTIL